jgi:Tripartite tricarboxylate transporter TctB family
VRAGESKPFAELEWADGMHAAAVTVITAGAVYFFETLGFFTTMAAMMFVLLVAIERRPLLNAALYSVGVVGLTYLTFVYVLKTPLVTGPFGF